MPKLRKQRRKKVFKHNVNRKRLRNKLEGVGKILNTEIKNAWDGSKSVQTNLKEMGLAYDPNESIRIPKKKTKVVRAPLPMIKDEEMSETKQEEIPITKTYVAEALEADAKAPRAKMFRLPRSQVEYITSLMDKYGKDYKAMARDRKNYYQETWKQIRAKISKFKSIPEQYSVYLQKRNLDQSEGESDSGMSDGEL